MVRVTLLLYLDGSLGRATGCNFTKNSKLLQKEGQRYL